MDFIQRAGTAKLGRVPALDGVRGIAIVLVVLHNATAVAAGPPTGVFYPFALIVHSGWIGVQLFFALSGFLITDGLLATQGSANYFRGFYARRALRILPLYYGVLFALFVVAPRIVTLPPPFSTTHQASLWLFTANWQATPYGFEHFWSLAVEEQFYVFWPLVVWKLNAGRLLKVCVWIAIGALLLRVLLASLGADPGRLYESTLCRMDALSLGGAGVCILRLRSSRQWAVNRSKAAATAACLLFLGGAAVTHAYNTHTLAGESLGYSVLAICCAACVTLTAVPQSGALGRFVTLLSWRPLRLLGIYSYAMYVFHNLLHKLIGEPWLVARFAGHAPYWVVVLYSIVVLAITYVLALCSYHAWEKHFLRLKDRIWGHPVYAGW